MNSRHLVDRFAAVRERGEALVLVTVYETLGSTYSKAGTRMLITAGGESQGLVSGGCLEGDLAARARRVLESGEAVAVTYDLRDDADELFGLGIGCNGLISVLLQPLSAETGYEPMNAIAAALLGTSTAGLATVVSAGANSLAAPGMSVLVGDGESQSHGLPPALEEALRDGALSAIAARSARFAALADGSRALFAPIVPIPRVLILGAGLDAVPLVNVLAELGWRVSVADHRPAYLDREGFARAESRRVVRPDHIGAELDPGSFDAIVIMSHHLLTDRDYLRALAAIETPYLGLLGPPARRTRLLAELGPAAGSLPARLRGPVGIDIGADSAESIALSIAAEMQSVLSTDVLSDFRRRV